MADIAKLQEFASNNNFGLTSPLTHAQVVALAEHWFPEMRFFEKEKFHPISLDEKLHDDRRVVRGPAHFSPAAMAG
jgi:hypothetical protein